MRKIYDSKEATFYNDIAFGFIAALRLINNAIDKNVKAKEIKNFSTIQIFTSYIKIKLLIEKLLLSLKNLNLNMKK